MVLCGRWRTIHLRILRTTTKTMNNKSLEQRIKAIEVRNAQKQRDKAWETSTLRRICILLLTYILMCIVFTIAQVQQPFFNASIPTIGYGLSTITLSWVRKKWEKYMYTS